MPRKPRSLYDVLEVQPSADARTIKTSYRRLARELHPDRTISDAPHIRAQKEKRFKEIAGAYTILSNPDSRARYDRGLDEMSEMRARNPSMHSKRFNDFMERMSSDGVNRGNMDDMVSDFLDLVREFKKDTEIKTAKKPQGGGGVLGLIEDLFGLEVKVGGKKR